MCASQLGCRCEAVEASECGAAVFCGRLPSTCTLRVWVVDVGSTDGQVLYQTSDCLERGIISLLIIS